LSVPSLSVPAGTVGGMDLHRVTIDTAWRPDYSGQQRRQHLARCLCGWSAGWLATRTEAAKIGDEHRSVAAVTARRARTPGPAA
jgi:hypothetical protein